MKLDNIVAELNQELDKLEKDESIGKIAAYINESWQQKANFMQYLLDRYSTSDKDAAKETSMRKYIYGAAAVTAGFTAVSYALFRTPPVDNAIPIFLVGYISLLTAIGIGKNKRTAFINKSLDYAVKNGNFRQDLLDFYKNLKD